MPLQGFLSSFPFIRRGTKAFGPSFQSSFESSEFAFPDKERGAEGRLIPGIGNNLMEAIQIDPDWAEPKGDGA